MNDGLQTIDIIFFAMVAAFILLRLRSVLGRRTGNEPTPPAEGPARRRAAAAGGGSDERDEEAEGREPESDEAHGHEAMLRTMPLDVRHGLEAICRKDRSFRIGHFLEGAEAAYRMILEGFWEGRLDDIRGFLGDEVRKDFADAVRARERGGLAVENRLLETSRTEIETATLDGKTAEIAIRFESEIIAVTRDADGHVVEGDVTDTVRVTDIWTFARDLGSRDPNWTLIETRAG